MGVHCGSGLARDAGDAVYLIGRVDFIASKPAPTGGRFSALQFWKTAGSLPPPAQSGPCRAWLAHRAFARR
ncbi:hypothetical protein C7A07_00750 [Pseudomonas fragi]|nr:hypothetical protein C7A07_00750 [Pseudomonas fragi]